MKKTKSDIKAEYEKLWQLARAFNQVSRRFDYPAPTDPEACRFGEEFRAVWQDVESSFRGHLAVPERKIAEEPVDEPLLSVMVEFWTEWILEKRRGNEPNIEALIKIALDP